MLCIISLHYVTASEKHNSQNVHTFRRSSFYFRKVLAVRFQEVSHRGTNSISRVPNGSPTIKPSAPRQSYTHTHTQPIYRLTLIQCPWGTFKKMVLLLLIQPQRAPLDLCVRVHSSTCLLRCGGVTVREWNQLGEACRIRSTRHPFAACGSILWARIWNFATKDNKVV